MVTDIWIDRQRGRQTDIITGRQVNEWMDMRYMCIDMQKTMYIRTNRLRDQRTDILSYRDAMATSTKFNSDNVGLESIRTTGYCF